MGKTGSWFSAIKKAFTPHSNSKEKLVVVPNESDKKNAKKKKWGIGRLKHGDTTSFIPLKREPSSIEKILGDADREHGKIQAVSSDLQRTASTLPSTPSDLQRTASTLPSVAVRHNEQVNLRTKSTTAIATAANLRTKSTTAIATATATAANLRTKSTTAIATATAANLRTKSTTATATTTNNNNNNNNTNTNNKRTINSSNHNITTMTTFTPNRNHHTAATKIQSIYRGYMARRSFRALKGLVRLQGVIRGQSVKRQTMNAMKYMQFLVKIQTQIQSRRIQTLENQALQRQNLHKNNKEFENSLGRWILTQSEAGQENWDDSLLTKEEIDARMQRKVEAIIKRERALAYAHNHQFLKATPKSLMEIRSGGLPLWWNWIDRQLPENHSEFQAAIQAKNEQTPPRQPIRTPDARSLSSNYKQPSLRFNNTEILTPRSSKSPLAAMSKTKQESGVSSRVSQANISTPVSNARKPRTNGPDFSLDTPLRDDESLTSCPPFSVPNYMVPTVSAKAKVRAHSNPKDRFGATPTNEQKRRLSFPLTQSISSLRWTKGSLFSSKDSSSQFVLGKHKPVQSISNLSVDSTVSLPAGLGRKPFK